MMTKNAVFILCLFIQLMFSSSSFAENRLAQILEPLLVKYPPQQTGSYILDKGGEEALLARAWLTDHAVHSIDVQYFIWSFDNIGTLATESLLRAADRGVHVRVLVDDLLVDAPDDFFVGNGSPSCD